MNDIILLIQDDYTAVRTGCRLIKVYMLPWSVAICHATCGITSLGPWFAHDNFPQILTCITQWDCIHATCIFIVFCVGGSKAPPVLYSSYRTHNVWTGAVTSYSV